MAEAIDALLARMEQEAGAEVNAVLAEARARAADIEARAEAEAERRRRAARDRLDADGREAMRRAVATAERRHRAARLTARAAAVNRVFAEARRRLAGLAVERYAARLPDLVRGAIRFLDDGGGAIEVRADAMPLVSQGLQGRETIRVAPRDEAAAGVLARAADGRLTIDNTLPTRLERVAPDLAIALVARVEGG